MPRVGAWILLILVLGLAGSPAVAMDTELSRSTLKGLRGVSVMIESLEPEVERDGLSRSTIETDVELKLRQAGITVVPPRRPKEFPRCIPLRERECDTVQRESGALRLLGTRRSQPGCQTCEGPRSPHGCGYVEYWDNRHCWSDEDLGERPRERQRPSGPIRQRVLGG